MAKIPFYKDPYFYRKHIYLLFIYLISIIVAGFVPFITTTTCNLVPFGELCEQNLSDFYILTKASLIIQGIIAFVTIGSYKKLKLLKNLIAIIIVLNLIEVGAMVSMLNDAKINIGLILFAVLILPLIVAFLSVKNDINKLKSSERFV